MLAVPLSASEAAPLLAADLSIAAVNSPTMCVISGQRSAVTQLNSLLAQRGVLGRYLRVDHAFHSQMMDGALEPFRAHVSGIRLRPPEIPMISNVSGTWISPEEATDPQYWVRHLRQTVQFASGVEKLLQEPNRILLEVGPGHTLTNLALQTASKASDAENERNRTEDRGIPSMRLPEEDEAFDLPVILEALGRLWLFGVPIDWPSFSAAERRFRIPLPTYPFERERFSLSSKETIPNLGSFRRESIDRWCYTPSWKRLGTTVATNEMASDASGSPVLVFSGQDEFSRQLEAQLISRFRMAGHHVITARPGQQYMQIAQDDLFFDP